MSNKKFSSGISLKFLLFTCVKIYKQLPTYATY